MLHDGNTILADKTLDVRFGMLQGAPAGSEVWNETHIAVTTNAFGLLNLKVGDVNGIDVDWGAGPYFLKVQLDLKDGLREWRHIWGRWG